MTPSLESLLSQQNENEIHIEENKEVEIEISKEEALDLGQEIADLDYQLQREEELAQESLDLEFDLSRLVESSEELDLSGMLASLEKIGDVHNVPSIYDPKLKTENAEVKKEAILKRIKDYISKIIEWFKTFFRNFRTSLAKLWNKLKTALFLRKKKIDEAIETLNKMGKNVINVAINKLNKAAMDLNAHVTGHGHQAEMSFFRAYKELIKYSQSLLFLTVYNSKYTQLLKGEPIKVKFDRDEESDHSFKDAVFNILGGNVGLFSHIGLSKFYYKYQLHNENTDAYVMLTGPMSFRVYSVKGNNVKEEDIDFKAGTTTIGGVFDEENIKPSLLTDSMTFNFEVILAHLELAKNASKYIEHAFKEVDEYGKNIDKKLKALKDNEKLDDKVRVNLSKYYRSEGAVYAAVGRSKMSFIYKFGAHALKSASLVTGYAKILEKENTK
jgi:hypothetical protein